MARILVAEDEKDIRELITFTLRFAGHEVATTADGKEVVEAAREILPDLILMDVRMPRLNGYEACALLKQDQATRHIPVVFLSAKGQEVEIQTGFEVGADEYIVKPFAPDQLAERIRTILAGYGKV